MKLSEKPDIITWPETHYVFPTGLSVRKIFKR